MRVSKAYGLRRRGKMSRNVTPCPIDQRGSLRDGLTSHLLREVGVDAQEGFEVDHVRHGVATHEGAESKVNLGMICGHVLPISTEANLSGGNRWSALSLLFILHRLSASSPQHDTRSEQGLESEI